MAVNTGIAIFLSSETVATLFAYTFLLVCNCICCCGCDCGCGCGNLFLFWSVYWLVYEFPLFKVGLLALLNVITGFW